MKLFWSSLPSSILIVAMLAAVAAVADEPITARVSFDSGTGMVKGKADANWIHAVQNRIILAGDTLSADKEGRLEVEMPGGAFLRMGGQEVATPCQCEVASLTPSVVLHAKGGSFYLQRVSRSTGDVTFETPLCKVVPAPNSMVRIDVAENGATKITVHWGHAGVRYQGGPEEAVDTGQRTYIDPGYAPSVPAPFNMAEEDALDSWNRERARQLATGEPTPAAPAQLETLSRYGHWVYADSGYYWCPTAYPGYVPYYYGCWDYMPGFGYFWAESYPFSFITCYYGHWHYHSHYGWLWGAGGGWHPRLATTRFGAGFGIGPVLAGKSLYARPLGFSPSWAAGRTYQATARPAPPMARGAGPSFGGPGASTRGHGTSFGSSAHHMGSPGSGFSGGGFSHGGGMGGHGGGGHR